MPRFMLVSTCDKQVTYWNKSELILLFQIAGDFLAGPLSRYRINVIPVELEVSDLKWEILDLVNRILYEAT